MPRRELSYGRFSDSNQKALAGNPSEVPVYEAKMGGGMRLVYQVDCGPEVYKYSDVSLEVFILGCVR